MAYCALCGFFGNFPVTSTPSMGISAPGGNSSRSLRAASTIADPQQVIPLDPPAPEVLYFFMDFVNHPAPDGMESLESVTGRLGEFLEEIREEAAGGGDILISTHAIAMKGALEYLTPDSKGSYWSKYIGNCGIYQIGMRDGEYEVPFEIRA